MRWSATSDGSCGTVREPADPLPHRIGAHQIPDAAFSKKLIAQQPWNFSRQGPKGGSGFTDQRSGGVKSGNTTR